VRDLAAPLLNKEEYKMFGLIHLIFFLIVAVTVVGSVWLSRKYKERYAEFPWWKAGLLIAIEIIAWVICIKLLEFALANWWWLIPVTVVILIIAFRVKKKKEEQIL
jgi:uncharacterized protein YacL